MKFFVIIVLMTKVVFAQIHETKQSEALKYQAYYLCADQARIGSQLNPMISGGASDENIAKTVFELKTNDEDDHITSHCFYFCVFEHMALISNPGAVLKPNKKTVAFGKKFDKRAAKKCLDKDEINLCKRIDFFFMCLLDL
uniref:Uncharacterized protein n=1 Tax=Glossina palpalis gambiensis TaxID=67801 RepID=A0A1B0BJ27_9MUSC